MKALVLDDDKEIAGFLKGLLERFFPQFNVVDMVHSGPEAAQMLQQAAYDLLLFDVELGNNTSTFDFIDGFEIGNARIIFITGHPDYAINAIKVDAVDYVLKPIQLEEFRKAVGKAIITGPKTESKAGVEVFNELQKKRITIHELEHVRFITIEMIEALEASGPYTHIYLTDGKQITSSKHLKYYEDMLHDCGFFRIHNSFLINTLHVRTMNKRDGSSVIMSSEKEFALSIRRKDDFLTFMQTQLNIG